MMLGMIPSTMITSLAASGPPGSLTIQHNFVDGFDSLPEGHNDPSTSWYYKLHLFSDQGHTNELKGYVVVNSDGLTRAINIPWIYDHAPNETYHIPLLPTQTTTITFAEPTGDIWHNDSGLSNRDQTATYIPFSGSTVYYTLEAGTSLSNLVGANYTVSYASDRGTIQSSSDLLASGSFNPNEDTTITMNLAKGSSGGGTPGSGPQGSFSLSHNVDMNIFPEDQRESLNANWPYELHFYSDAARQNELHGYVVTTPSGQQTHLIYVPDVYSAGGYSNEYMIPVYPTGSGTQMTFIYPGTDYWPTDENLPGFNPEEKYLLQDWTGGTVYYTLKAGGTLRDISSYYEAKFNASGMQSFEQDASDPLTYHGSFDPTGAVSVEIAITKAEGGGGTGGDPTVFGDGFFTIENQSEATLDYGLTFDGRDNAGNIYSMYNACLRYAICNQGATPTSWQDLTDADGTWGFTLSHGQKFVVDISESTLFIKTRNGQIDTKIPNPNGNNNGNRWVWENINIGIDVHPATAISYSLDKRGSSSGWAGDSPWGDTPKVEGDYRFTGQFDITGNTSPTITIIKGTGTGGGTIETGDGCFTITNAATAGKINYALTFSVQGPAGTYNLCGSSLQDASNPANVVSDEGTGVWKFSLDAGQSIKFSLANSELFKAVRAGQAQDKTLGQIPYTYPEINIGIYENSEGTNGELVLETPALSEGWKDGPSQIGATPNDSPLHEAYPRFTWGQMDITGKTNPALTFNLKTNNETLTFKNETEEETAYTATFSIGAGATPMGDRDVGATIQDAAGNVVSSFAPGSQKTDANGQYTFTLKKNEKVVFDLGAQVFSDARSSGDGQNIGVQVTFNNSVRPVHMTAPTQETLPSAAWPAQTGWTNPTLMGGSGSPYTFAGFLNTLASAEVVFGSDTSSTADGEFSIKNDTSHKNKYTIAFRAWDGALASYAVNYTKNGTAGNATTDANGAFVFELNAGETISLDLNSPLFAEARNRDSGKLANVEIYSQSLDGNYEYAMCETHTPAEAWPVGTSLSKSGDDLYVFQAQLKCDVTSALVFTLDSSNGRFTVCNNASESYQYEISFKVETTPLVNQSVTYSKVSGSAQADFTDQTNAEGKITFTLDPQQSAVFDMSTGVFEAARQHPMHYEGINIGMSIPGKTKNLKLESYEGAWASAPVLYGDRDAGYQFGGQISDTKASAKVIFKDEDDPIPAGQGRLIIDYNLLSLPATFIHPITGEQQEIWVSSTTDTESCGYFNVGDVVNIGLKYNREVIGEWDENGIAVKLEAVAKGLFETPSGGEAIDLSAGYKIPKDGLNVLYVQWDLVCSIDNNSDQYRDHLSPVFFDYNYPGAGVVSGEYAIWENPYQTEVYINGNLVGHSWKPNHKVTVVFNCPTDPVRLGYLFLGWVKQDTRMPPKATQYLLDHGNEPYTAPDGTKYFTYIPLTGTYKGDFPAIALMQDKPEEGGMLTSQHQQSEIEAGVYNPMSEYYAARVDKVQDNNGPNGIDVTMLPENGPVTFYGLWYYRAIIWHAMGGDFREKLGDGSLADTLAEGLVMSENKGEAVLYNFEGRKKGCYGIGQNWEHYFVPEVEKNGEKFKACICIADLGGIRQTNYIPIVGGGYNRVHPARTGYGFNGWYYDPQCMVPINETDNGVQPYRNYYAGWLPETVTVNYYDTREGTGFIGSQEFKYGDAVTLMQNINNTSGWDFVKWKNAPDATDPIETDGKMFDSDFIRANNGTYYLEKVNGTYGDMGHWTIDLYADYSQKYADYTVTIDWDDYANNDGIRPLSVEIGLISSVGNTIIQKQTLTEDNATDNHTWQYTFKELPITTSDTSTEKVTYSFCILKYQDINGIEYEIGDTQATTSTIPVTTKSDIGSTDAASFYTYRLRRYSDGSGTAYNSYNGHVYMNHNLILTGDDIKFTIQWDDDSNRDGVRPDVVTLTLYDQNGNRIAPTLVDNLTGNSGTQSVSEGMCEVSQNGNAWTYVFKDYQKYTNGGELAGYTVGLVDSIDEYSIHYLNGTDSDENGVILKHVPERVSKDVSIHWDDELNRDGLRPEEVTVTLTAYQWN